MNPPAATEGQGADMALLARLRYIATDTDRHGNLRVYVRRHGRKIRLRETPGTKAFMAEYQAALAGTSTPAPPRRQAPDDGSLQHLIDSYMKSATWRALSPSTQKLRRSILNRTAAEVVGDHTAGSLPVSAMARRHVVMLRDRVADRPAAANNRVKMLRQMFSWAIENDLIGENPARHVRSLDMVGNSWTPWTLEDIDTFARHHADDPRAMLALHLLVWTGVRRSDVVTLGQQHIRTIDGQPHLVFTMTKGRKRRPRRVEHLISPPLKQAIDRWADPAQLTFLTNQWGRPYTVEGFGNSFRKWCQRAGLADGLSAHGIRKGVAAMTAELGASEHQIMAMLDHATPSQGAVYTRSANRRRMSGEAVTSLSTKLSHLHPGKK